MEEKYEHKIITIPNVLSFFRLLLIPVIGGLLVLLLCLPVGSKEENKYGPAL